MGGWQYKYRHAILLTCPGRNSKPRESFDSLEEDILLRWTSICIFGSLLLDSSSVQKYRTSRELPSFQSKVFYPVHHSESQNRSDSSEICGACTTNLFISQNLCQTLGNPLFGPSSLELSTLFSQVCPHWGPNLLFFPCLFTCKSSQSFSSFGWQNVSYRM